MSKEKENKAAKMEEVIKAGDRALAAEVEKQRILVLQEDLLENGMQHQRQQQDAPVKHKSTRSPCN